MGKFTEFISVILIVILAVALIIFITKLAAIILVIGVLYYAIRYFTGKTFFNKDKKDEFFDNHW